MFRNIMANLNSFVGETVPTAGNLPGMIMALGSEPEVILAQGISQRNAAMIHFGLKGVAGTMSFATLNRHMYTILHNSIFESSEDITRFTFFIKMIGFRGAQSFEMTFDEYNGNTLMHVAAQNGYEAVVATLMELGVNDDLPNASGQKPVQLAYRHLKTMKLLLEKYPDKNKRADLIIQPSNGKSLLELAVDVNQIEVVEYLLDQPGVISALQDNPAYRQKVEACIKDKTMEIKIQKKLNPTHQPQQHQEYIKGYSHYTPQNNLTINNATTAPVEQPHASASHRRVGFSIYDN